MEDLMRYSDHPSGPSDPDPLIEFVKALARRQARLDAIPPKAANSNLTTKAPARHQ